jgi:hypothetical protein
MGYVVFSNSSIITLAKVFIALTVGLFAVSLGLYVWRCRTFPIAQRYPVLVIIEAVSFGIVGLNILLSIAFPLESSISNCKIYHEIIAIGEMFGIATTTVRVVLVLGKDLRTRDLMKKEGMNQTSEVQGIADQCLLVEESIVRFAWRFLSDFQIALLIVLPAFCISIAICFVAFMSTGVQDTLLIEDACFEKVGRVVVFLQAGMFLYLGVGLSFASILILRLKDNFFIGLEIRLFLLGMAVLAILTLSILELHDYRTMVVNSRAYGFITGGFVIPTTHCVQLAFPVYLSLRNERILRKQKEDNLSSTQANSRPKKVFTYQVLSDSLDNLLLTTEGRCILIEFLQSEFSVENLFFIESCAAFQKMCHSQGQVQSDQLLNQVKRILDNFISEKAISPVNLSHKVKAPLSAALSSFLGGTVQAIDPTLFDEAVKEVRKMLVMDSFQRFRVSSEYMDFIARDSSQIRDVSQI